MDLILERAKELREAGVSSIQIEGSTVVFAPLPAQVDMAPDEPTRSLPPVDPLLSPETYADGVVPGFTMMVK